MQLLYFPGRRVRTGKTFLQGAVVALALLTTSTASAFMFGTSDTLFTVGIDGGDIGDSFIVNWLLETSDSGISTDLSATGLFTVDDLTSSLLTLTVDLTNTTDGSFQAAILAIGFSVDPNGDGEFAMDGEGLIFDNVGAGSGPNQTFPGGFKDIDVCIFAANNCSGGNINQGLQSGGSMDTFTLNISGTFGTEPMVTLDSFPIKFQTEQGSFEFPGTPIPEPGTVLLIGSGLVGLGAGVWRRRKHIRESE